MDINAARIAAWNSERLPIYEPGLHEIVMAQVRCARGEQVIMPRRLPWWAQAGRDFPLLACVFFLFFRLALFSIADSATFLVPREHSVARICSSRRRWTSTCGRRRLCSFV